MDSDTVPSESNVLQMCQALVPVPSCISIWDMWNGKASSHPINSGSANRRGQNGCYQPQLNYLGINTTYHYLPITTGMQGTKALHYSKLLLVQALECFKQLLLDFYIVSSLEAGWWSGLATLGAGQRTTLIPKCSVWVAVVAPNMSLG